MHSCGGRRGSALRVNRGAGCCCRWLWRGAAAAQRPTYKSTSRGVPDEAIASNDSAVSTITSPATSAASSCPHKTAGSSPQRRRARNSMRERYVARGVTDAAVIDVAGSVCDAEGQLSLALPPRSVRSRPASLRRFQQAAVPAGLGGSGRSSLSHFRAFFLRLARKAPIPITLVFFPRPAPARHRLR